MSIHLKKSRFAWMLFALINLMLLAGAGGVIAQEATPQANPEATPEATAEATAEAAPVDDYTFPAEPDTIDPDQVIARVGDDEITVREFRGRVRLFRFIAYRQLETLVSSQGPEVLDLTSPTNPVAADLDQFLAQLSSDYEVGASTIEEMLIESVYHQEAVARDVEVDLCEVNRLWMNNALLALQEVGECVPPDNFEEEKSALIERAARFTGLTPEEIESWVYSFIEQQAVVDALREEVIVPDVRIVRSRQITVADRQAALDIRQQLEAGEDFQALLLENTLDDGAVGNGGNLGTFGPGDLAGAFGQAVEDAVYAAEAGELVGPAEGLNGWHVVEVIDRTPGLRLRQIVLRNLDEAEAALTQIRDEGQDLGDLAEVYSIDATRTVRGELGYDWINQAAPEFVAAVSGAEAGDLIGPFQTQQGFHVVEVVEVSDAQARITARHIVTETEAEGQAALERIQAGEAFADVATAVSIDPAAGHRGDTNQILSRGQRSGFYAEGDYAIQYNALMEAIFAGATEPGVILGPIEVPLGWAVIEIQAISTRAPTDDEIALAQQEVLREFQENGVAAAQETGLWRQFIPADPMPSAFGEAYAPLDEVVIAYSEEAAVRYSQDSVISVLGDLEVVEYFNNVLDVLDTLNVAAQEDDDQP